MTGQQLTFQDGATLRDRGVARVSSNADPEWVAAVDAIILERADSGHPFTSESVRYIAAKHGIGEPHHPSAWSARFAAASKRRIITKTGRYYQSRRPERHSAVVAEWVGAWTA